MKGKVEKGKGKGGYKLADGSFLSSRNRVCVGEDFRGTTFIIS